jgi:uncharacterized membrane-anchored protein
MPKPTTGRIEREPEPRRPQRATSQADAREPDAEQMMTNAWMASVFTGLSLIVSTAYFATIGAFGLFIGREFAGSTGAKVGLGVGLAVGAAVAVVVLRRYGYVLKRRSPNLHRGTWIGMVLAVSIIVVMAYFPWVMPTYCPPGAIC